MTTLNSRRWTALLALVCFALPVAAQPAASDRVIPISNIPHSAFKGIKLPMIQRSVLSGIEGRLGHMAFDLLSGRLYVACRAVGSIDALDAMAMKTAQSIPGIPEPIGMAFAPDLRTLFVSCGDGSVRSFKADRAGQLTEDRKVEFPGEAVSIQYDPEDKRVYVGHGRYFSWFDATTGEKSKEIELSARPESILLDRSGPRIFVSVGRKNEIAVIDRNEGKVVTTWKLKDAGSNSGMAADFDAGTGRLFVACRSPAVMLVLDMTDGREIARVPIDNDADDIWYDAPGKRIYVTCGGGGGKVAMILQNGPDAYQLEHSEGTNAGAATSIHIPERRKLIVGAPKVGPDGYTFVYIYVLPP